MERVNEIIRNKEYNRLLYEIEELEKDRIFCRHNMIHFLDVARIGSIICYEEGINVEKGLIYAAALLHDIGRGAQYKDGTPHEKASAEQAAKILKECGFSRNETASITEAIREHGNEEVKGRKDLAGVLYRADKLSRKCFECKAINECHKSVDKKNMWVFY